MMSVKEDVRILQINMKLMKERITNQDYIIEQLQGKVTEQADINNCLREEMQLLGKTEDPIKRGAITCKSFSYSI